MPPSAEQPHGGSGWQSTIRVRMLHTRVRQRILGRLDSLKGKYDVETDGVPVNQEDLAATLSAFSSAALAVLPRLGICPSQQEREDYIALWRHLGYYMGVDASTLRRYFSSAYAADRFTLSVTRHLFSELETCIRSGLEPPPSATVPLLIAVSGRKPYHTPLEVHCGIARQCMGPKLASALGVPPTPARTALILEGTYFTLWYPSWFGARWRRGWEATRTSVARPFLRRVIQWSMGERTSRYGGQEEENASVFLDPDEGKQLVSRYRGMVREMIAVSAAAIFLPAAIAAAAFAAV